MLALSLFAVACGGSDGDGDNGDGDNEATPTRSANDGETPTPSDGDGGSLVSLAELSSEGATGRVTYRVSGAGQTAGEWTVVQKPPNSRIEFASTEPGSEGRTIIIVTEDKSYVCFSASGQENCIETPSSQTQDETAPLDPLFSIPNEIIADAEAVNVLEESDRTIAGVDAKCFTVESGLADLAEGEMCFSEEGMLLYLRTGSGATEFTFEAIDASTDVSDSDFEPPYEIFDLPGQ